MKIGLIDADLLDNGTRFPNLALMKISSHYKTKNNNVDLLTNYLDVLRYDKVFISKVFTFTELPSWVLQSKNVKMGGTGFYRDGGANLPEEIEHVKPDYNLYNSFVSKKYHDYFNFSIGFTTRGCFRKCEFCVNKKYDKAFRHSSINEFLDQNRKYIYLLDDNILAYSGWENVLNELEKTNKRFQFKQGLDLRLMTDKKAKRFANTNYYGEFIFAFDDIKDKDFIIKKLNLWKKYSNKAVKMYVLCGFDKNNNYTNKFFEQDIINTFERIKILMENKSLPYIMRFQDLDTGKKPYIEYGHKGIYITMSRWCNQPSFFKKLSFREYCNKAGGSALEYMKKFELENKKIAKEYFDVKWEV